MASENPGIAFLCQIPEKQPQEDVVVRVVSVSAHLQRFSNTWCVRFCFWTVGSAPGCQNTDKRSEE